MSHMYLLFNNRSNRPIEHDGINVKDKSKSRFRKRLQSIMDAECAKHGFDSSPKTWGTVQFLTCLPKTLFYCVFPGLVKYVRKRKHLMCGLYATTNGHAINFLFVNMRKPLKQEDNVPDHKDHMPSDSVKHAVEPKVSLSSVTGTRRVGSGLNRRHHGQVARERGLLDLEKEIAEGNFKKGALFQSSGSASGRKCAMKR